MKKLLLPFFILSLYSLTSFSQSNLFIDTTFTVEEMVMDFFDDPNIQVSNVTSISSNINSGFFDAGGTDLGLDAGIVLSSGNILDIVGPNSLPLASTNLQLAGDSDINLLGNTQSNDAVLMEFDFTVSQTDTLHFNYVFGSEEYPEWVGTDFNDAFAFLISGPGISGPFSNNSSNIALIPNSSEAVAINSVNAMQNSDFFVDNENGMHVRLDGFTVPLPSSFFAVAGETYHIKLVLSDRGDGIFDSGVFLSFNSLNQDSLLLPPTNFQVSIDPNSNAVEFINESKYARSWQWDFGNGDTSSLRNPGVINYTNPGDYTVTLTTQNFCCSQVYTETITITTAPLGTNVSTIASCAGSSTGEINVEIFGGTPPYSIVWSNGETTPTISNLPAGSFSYTVTDAENIVFSDIVNLEETLPIEIDNVISTSPNPGQNNGSISVTVTGGTPPYLYNWLNGGPDNIGEGTYTLEITDANGCTIETSFTLIAILTVDFNTSNVSCFGGSDGSIDILASGGIPPYTISSPTDNLIAGNYAITLIDANGQSITLQIPISEPSLIEVVSTTNPANDSNSDGSASVSVAGGTPPYNYLWSNGSTSNEVVNLAPGEYTVEVTDDNNCIHVETVVIESITSVIDNNEIAVSLFPNPVIDQLQVEWSENNKIENVFIVNVLGQTIAADFELNGNRLNISFDEKWIKGTYFLQLHFDNGKKSTARFVLEDR